MNNIFVQEYNSPAGILLIGVYKNSCCLCDWKYRKQRSSIDSRIQEFTSATYINEVHALHKVISNQLDSYFAGTLQEFTIELLFCGSTFQQSVWEELCKIRYGEVISYSSLSRKLNNPKAVRAVATANGANALSILVPCHRVIGSNGALTGYAGGLYAKEKLLNVEGALWNGQQKLF
jgi:methylated-DNA-[protein]-cysteine S-methyltransferase